MIRLIFEFAARGYHATPWGHHVNEGLVEWPPSPWRILRALISVGYTKMGWQQVPQEMADLVELMAEQEPMYRLPRATAGHSRHYMPVRGLKKGRVETSLVIDAFLEADGPLVVDWPARADERMLQLLRELVPRLSYLGRAESRVKVRLGSNDGPDLKLPEIIVTTERQQADYEPVRLLAPMRAAEYTAWCKDFPGAPKNLLEALQMETGDVQKGGWNMPPGAREVVYWLPCDAMERPQSGRETGMAVKSRREFDTALFVLSTNFRRSVLPLMERAYPTMALFRKALLAMIGDLQVSGACPELTGKDMEGAPLRLEHAHAHYIPLCLSRSQPPRIDHVLVHAPMGFGPIAERALRRIRRTWAKGFEEVAVTLVALGQREFFSSIGGERVMELSSGRVWVSRTPFVPPRHLKRKGKDTLQGQIRAELEARGLPELACEPVVTSPTAGTEFGRQALWFRHFALTRQGGEAPPESGIYHVTIQFKEEVRGPLCLGWGSHYGLGLFVPLTSQPE